MYTYKMKGGAIGTVYTDKDIKAEQAKKVKEQKANLLLKQSIQKMWNDCARFK